MRQAAGFIEMRGLAAAIRAADIALKSANVELIGVELTRGMGYAVVKIQGDVGAVKAAVDSAISAPETIPYFVAKDVIPRPSLGLDQIVYSEATIGLSKENEEEEPQEAQEDKEIEANKQEEAIEENDKEVKEEVDEGKDQEEDTEEPEENQEDLDETSGNDKEVEEEQEEETQEEATCNLCHDPKCPRKKGEPRKDCLHYDEIVEKN